MTKKLIVLVITTLATFAPISSTAQDWITEEVLTQLTEIRQELSALREDVQALQNAGSAGAGDSGGNSAFVLSSERSVPTLGDANASVVIVEFSDYQCPYCRRHAQETYPSLKANYIDSGEIQYAVMDFPLSFHPLAKPAAIAARCAAQQSKDSYWSFHDHFFGDSPNPLEAESYTALAQTENLNMIEFSTCLDNPSVAQAVDAEMGYGGSMGVTGTPAFFIGIKDGDEITNIQMLSGAQPYSVFTQVIDRLLDQS